MTNDFWNARPVLITGISQEDPYSWAKVIIFAICSLDRVLPLYIWMSETNQSISAKFRHFS